MGLIIHPKMPARPGQQIRVIVRASSNIPMNLHHGMSAGNARVQLIGFLNCHDVDTLPHQQPRNLHDFRRLIRLAPTMCV